MILDFSNLPWEVCKEWRAIDGKLRYVCDIVGSESSSHVVMDLKDAQLATHCVNNHEKLVHALERLLASHADFVACQGDPQLGTPNLEWSQEIEDEARNVLSELQYKGGVV